MNCTCCEYCSRCQDGTFAICPCQIVTEHKFNFELQRYEFYRMINPYTGKWTTEKLEEFEEFLT